MTINKKTQTDEIRRCARDPLYFINAYVKVSHAIEGTIPFQTYPFQDDCVRAFLDNRFVIVNKSRQLGLSTIAAAYSTWLLLFHRNKEILIMATKLSVAMNFIRKVKQCIDGLPKWLVIPKIEKSNEQSLVMGSPSKSRITAIPTASDAGRSEALSLLIVDEAAHVHDFEELWKGLYPTLSTGGRALIISTPKGVGNWFHKLWVDAKASANEFYPIELPWHVHPDRDQTWFEREKLNMSPKAVAQELLCVGGETRIITKNGFKLARDIVVGDEVMTHLGRFKPVLKTHSRNVDLSVENVYAISTPGNRKTSIIMTGNHPVSSQLLRYKTGGSVKWLQDNPENLDLQFRSVDDVVAFKAEASANRVVHSLFPVFRKCNATKTLHTIDLSTLMEGTEVIDDRVRYPRQWGSNKRFVPVDYDLGRVVGLWLSDGYANPNGRFGFGFGFHVEEYDTLLKFIDDYLKNLDIRTRPSKIHNTNGCRLESHNQLFTRLLWHFVDGRHAHDKLLRWDTVMAAGVEFIKGLLVGYFEGDGDHHPHKKLKVVSVHSELLYQVRTLLSMFGHYPRIGHWKNQPAYLELDNVRQRGLSDIIENTKVDIELKTSRTRLIGDDIVGSAKFTRINDEIEGQLSVYNFEVADDHTYVADSIVVHNCDFLASGDTYLEAADIAWVGEMIRAPIAREGPDKNVWIWEHPIHDPSFKYIISADVASGSSDDFSAFHIICSTTGEVVAEFKGKVRPDILAQVLHEYGKRYNDALICPERNTYGHHTIIELVNRGYTNIYFEEKRGVYIGSYIPPDKIGEAGFSMQKDSRKRVVSKLEEVIRHKQLKVHSARLYDELKTFVTHNDKPQAQKNCHDDLIMSLAIGTWLFDASNVHSQFATQLNRAMLSGFGVSVNRFDNMEGSGNEVIPAWTSMVPYIGDPSTGANARRRRPQADNPTNISWLFR